MFAICLIIIGLALILLTVKAKDKRFNLYITLLGISFIVSGGINFFTIQVNNIVLKDLSRDLLIPVIVILIPLNEIYYILKNRTKVQAICVDYKDQSYSRRGIKHHSYAPILKFTANNKEYTCESIQCISKRQLKNDFYIGRERTIFINQKNPEIVLIQKKLSKDSVMFLIFGLFILYLCVAIF